MSASRVPPRSVSVLAAFVAALVLVAWSPAGPAAAVTCAAPVSYNGQDYCPGTISGVKATAYGTGARVVLQGVSVTARTSTTLTVEALEARTCPPGYFCGATMIQQSLTVTWKGSSRPSVGSVVNLFGTTRTNSLTPVGSTPSGGCYIDLC